MKTVIMSGIGAILTLVASLHVQAQDVRIRVELVNVKCGDTEDVTGADHFYVVSALSGGTKETSNSFITKHFRINDGQTKTFSKADRVLFDAKVPANGMVVGGMKAFDEDYAKDWEKQKENAKTATNALAAAAATWGGQGKTAGTVIKVAFEVYDEVSSLDKDDCLGTTQLKVPADGAKEEVRRWRMVEGGLGFSTWKYSVTYKIVRTKVNGVQPATN
jgi:hypothetical protein